MELDLPLLPHQETGPDLILVTNPHQVLVLDDIAAGSNVQMMDAVNPFKLVNSEIIMREGVQIRSR